MLSEEILIMINEYFDNELNKEKEMLLFSILSGNSEAREYFKKINFLQASVASSIVQVPQELDERIFSSVEKTAKKKDKSFYYQPVIKYASYAVIILLLLVNIFFFNRINSYEENLNRSVRLISEKSRTIELLLNNLLPAAEVKADFSNEIIIKSN